MEEITTTIHEYLALLKRKKWLFAIPATLIFFGVVMLALLWPLNYRSTATILIEQAEIPSEFVDGTVNDYVERRIESISRRVLVSENLARIITQYGLYPKKLERSPMSSVVDDMRDDVVLDIINTNVVTKTGQASTAAVAFTLSFDYPDAVTAQRITNELVSLYLNENLKERRERATQTASFLTQERQRVDQQLQELGHQLTDFRTKNAGALPDQAIFNQQSLTRLEQQVTSYSATLQSLREREAYLQQQVALTQPYMLSTQGGGASLSPTGQLMSMQTDLATLRGRYGPDHPDVQRLTRQIQALQQSEGIKPGAELERQRLAAEQNLQSLQQRYTPNHPDVQRAKRELANINAQIAASGKASQGTPDNPAYIELQSTLSGVKAQIPTIEDQLKTATQQLQDYQKLVSQTPAIQSQYDQLQQQIMELTERRNDLSQREMAAVLGQNVESELKGERFSLIEPPDLPLKPTGPSKIIIAAMALILAVGLSAALVVVVNLLDDGIYTIKDVTSIVGEPPLGIVPHIMTASDRTQAWSIRLGFIAMLVVLTGALAFVVNARVAPLDVLAISMANRVGDLVSPLFNGAPPPPQPPGQ